MSLAKYVVIAYVGAIIGTLIALAIVICFALIIVSGMANIYYATIFLAVGWGYAWKILKKNKIQFSFDTDNGEPNHA
jgi:hypothetical protein